ncbi:hypothetical protein PGT21_011528 [Puccinia graminis f. sp. tritici]|uniref:Uncharacterized protein n=1 Tax=Puccinia graminis f. sp. tritici TaxID=56615 RepID=A0A5B0LYE6_PUCGR|nr:hypothetical protein PGT21_011528 [Puccinia graminis f. sp. tritici]
MWHFFSNNNIKEPKRTVDNSNDETMRYDAINRPVSVLHRFSNTRLSDTDGSHCLSDASHRIGFAMRYQYQCIA